MMRCTQSTWVSLTSVVAIWASATVGKQRRTYCGEAGNSDLHMPRVPVALEHLHPNQHTRNHRHFLTLQMRERAMIRWALRCRPLLNIYQTLKFNYREDIYMHCYLLIYYTWTCSMIIVCVPNSAEMALLIMYDFLLCGKRVDKWLIDCN